MLNDFNMKINPSEYGVNKALTDKENKINNIDLTKYLDEEVTTKERNKMPESYFGLPNEKKYPMPDIAHLKSAIGYFSKETEPEKKKELAKNIVRRAKELHAEGKVHVYPENSLYEYVPDWLKANVKKKSTKSKDLNESVEYSTMSDFLRESIEDFRQEINPVIANPLYAVDLENISYNDNIPNCLKESIGLPDAKIIWSILKEDAMSKSLNEPLIYTIIYSNYCPLTRQKWDCTKINGGLVDMPKTDEDIMTFYKPSDNMYPASGMLNDLYHIKSVNKFYDLYNKFYEFKRNPEIDKPLITEWNNQILKYYDLLQNANTENDINKYRQYLYDLAWDYHNNPRDQQTRKNLILELIRSSDVMGYILSDTDLNNINIDNDIYLCKNGTDMSIQESIFDTVPVIKWFMIKKSQLRDQETNSRKNVSNSFFTRWKNFKLTTPVKVYEKMNTIVPNINNKFSMNDILSCIGIHLDGDIFRKYEGVIPLDQMRSMVEAGTFKNKDLDKFKGMILSYLYNYIFNISKKDTPILAPLTLNDAIDCIHDKVLGPTVSVSSIDNDVYALNTKVIPAILLHNVRIIRPFMDETKLIINNISKIIDVKENNVYKSELIIFKECLEYALAAIVELLLEYNDMLVTRLELMDMVYNNGEPLHENINIDPYNKVENNISLDEAIDIMLNNFGTIKPLIETIDQDKFKSAMPMLESVENVAISIKDIKKIIKDTNKETDKFKINDASSKLTVSLNKLKTYLFELNPDTAKKILPHIIEEATIFLLSTVTLNFIVSPFTSKLASVIITKIITLLYDFIMQVIDNGMNIKKADKNIELCNNKISEVNKKINDPTINKAYRSLLTLYKIRLNDFIAGLEEAKSQKDIINIGHELIKKKSMQETVYIINTDDEE